MKYLNRAQMKDGCVYAIICRNAYVGVWREHSQGFIIPRNKFGTWYLFLEYHWDTGAPYGTAKPYAFIEDCPIIDLEVNKNQEKGLEYLMALMEKAESIIEHMQEEERIRIEKEDQDKADRMGISYEKFQDIKYLKYKEENCEQAIFSAQKLIKKLEMLRSNGVEKYVGDDGIFSRNVIESLEMLQNRLKLDLEDLEKIRKQIFQIQKEIQDEKENSMPN